MGLRADDGGMTGFIAIVLLVLAGPLAYYAGIDSRVDEHRR
jgi:hypothetical protein